MAYRCAFATGFWLLAVGSSQVLAAEPGPSGVGAQGVSWRELRFGARKLGISASIDVRLDPQAQPAAAARPNEARDPGIAPDDGGFVLESTTHLPGRTFVAREVLEPAHAAAREIVDTETGAKHHRKTYTLSDRGFQLDVREPESVAEMLLPPERWTRITSSFTAYPEALPAGAVVTGPAGLLYVASGARLSAPGDSVTVYVLVQTQVERVTARVEDVEAAEVDFREESAGGLTLLREQRRVLRVVAKGEPVGAASASMFRLFGLEGDIAILWDPVRRLPVEIAGQMKMLGLVEVRLVSVTLR